MSSFSLKDQLFNREKVTKLAHELKKAHSEFKADHFIDEVCNKFPDLELKDRINWISHCLRRTLPHSYPDALSIILKALPEPCDPTLSDDDFGDFIYAGYNHYISENGCTHEHVTLSLRALEETTTRFSAEDAIRSFINNFPLQTLKQFKEWVSHPHYHVRRLVSEGTRPKLPWAKKIQYQQSEFLNLLDHLYKDKTRFVTRSVANHLNDISKFDPEAVLTRLKKWSKESKQTKAEYNFIRNHALRTLVKQGHKETLHFLGYSPTPDISTTLKINKKIISIGDTITFHISILAKRESKLIIDYVMIFKGKGERHSEKVFKLRKADLKKGESLQFSKTYEFKRNMTTRTFHPGEHRILLQINGKRHNENTFTLKH